MQRTIWDRKHDSMLAACLHGILHLQEGDLEDAENWYNRANHPFRSRGTLQDKLSKDMPTEFAYLFDPLCGWCYGASPVVQQLGQRPDVQMSLHPTGLFSGSGLVMDAHFAAFAWSNDQRIQQLTGQTFSTAYRQQVLGRYGSACDSTAATLALTAVGLDNPAAELPVLQQLQQARFVHGLDICSTAAVASLLQAWGHNRAAQRLREPDDALSLALHSRTQKARQLLGTLRTDGVPALAVRDSAGWRLLHRTLLYGTVNQLMEQATKT
jgi:putative protein-disulfide isomerase